MLLTADVTQDLFGHAARWTDEAMQGAGFDGPWAELEFSYRMPRELTDLAYVFVSEYMAFEDSVLPVPPDQQELVFVPNRIRWVQSSQEDLVDTAVDEIRKLVRESGRVLDMDEVVPFADVVFICDRIGDGRAISEALAERSIRVIDTFAEDSRLSRRQKRTFFKGDARVKGTTVHSFRGWEGRAIVMTIRGNGAAAAPIIYAGMTRLKATSRGSYLSVVSSAETYQAFGSLWPDYVDRRAIEGLGADIDDHEGGGVSDTVFTKVDYQLGTLISQIELGEIGLPDLQRPFVWAPVKVRDLFDSMYRGYPVGHLLFWSSGAEPGARQIGTDGKQLAPRLLIVDGQQRLTSLFAVMKQQLVVGKDFARKRIQIAFKPGDGTFAVADAATAKNPEYMQDIGEIWSRPAFEVINEFLARLDDAGVLDADRKRQVGEALQRLEALRTYPFTALVLGAEIEEAQVAEVFVRTNSQGKQLNQADFILTLMSVYWDEGRAALEGWSREVRTPGDAAYNAYLSPEPDHLLRVAIALGFRRGRLEDAYTVLRGRDPASGKVSPELRDAQFERLAKAQALVLDKEVWKEFLQCLLRAGHRSSATISSNLAIVYCYALYLIGKHDYHVPLKQLREVMARWFFMSSLTARYSVSPESTIASDLASLPTTSEPEAFIRRLDEAIAQQLTNDYWEITLPGELATSASRSPSLFGYLAALNILDAPVLFSKMRCAELFDPGLIGGKVKVQRHHLFPRKHLEGLGITDLRDVNQIANLAVLEWHDNLSISAADPRVYWPAYLDALRNPPEGMASFSEAEIESMVRFHAMPEGWHEMAYEDFLLDRRRRMAAVIRAAFERLVHGEQQEAAPSWPPSPAAIEHLLHEGETNRVEMKSSLRADTLGRGVPHKVLEKVVARTVAGFLNAQGGLLVIGADDHGVPLGLDQDLAVLPRKDLDGFQQTLVTVLSTYLGNDVAATVRIHLTKVGHERRDVALIECEPHPGPVFLNDGNAKEFHVRAGNTTRLMDVAEAASYIANHWKAKAA
jgi:hypothetical protein